MVLAQMEWPEGALVGLSSDRCHPTFALPLLKPSVLKAKGTFHLQVGKQQQAAGTGQTMPARPLRGPPFLTPLPLQRGPHRPLRPAHPRSCRSTRAAQPSSTLTPIPEVQQHAHSPYYNRNHLLSLYPGHACLCVFIFVLSMHVISSYAAECQMEAYIETLQVTKRYVFFK